MDVEHIARPAVFDGLLGIGEPPLWVFEPGEKHAVVAPGQLSNRLLDDCGIGPGFGAGSHVETEIARSLARPCNDAERSRKREV